MDVSKHEYCLKKESVELDGLQIQVYTLPMIMFEKLRAICQQMPEYAQAVTEPTQRARGRDFFDISLMLESRLFDPTSPENIELLKCIFNAKRVPLDFLGRIRDYREYHLQDFRSLLDTLKPSVIRRDFDSYFDHVVSFINQLEALGII